MLVYLQEVPSKTMGLPPALKGGKNLLNSLAHWLHRDEGANTTHFLTSGRPRGPEMEEAMG